MSPKTPRISVLFLALTLVAAACGGGETTSTTTAPDDSSGNPTTTASGDGNGSTTTGGDGETTTSSGPTTTLPPLLGLDLQLLTDGLQQPTFIVTPPGDDRMFIGERGGVIEIFDPATGTLSDTPFMSIPDRVKSNGIEQGLLGMAFHPDYVNNGRFFIYHTDRDAQRQLAEYKVQSDNPNRADLDSGKVLFDRAQPDGSTDIRHYAGQLTFGPDGYLWISSGDGAAGRVTGQSTDDYFGSILRIDVDSGDPFGIPEDNPYVDGGGAEAVWAIGLRNPWRFTFDGDLMYIADVGQADVEEINVVGINEPGTNFGWATMEGSDCFIPSDCDPSGLVLPIYEYTHSDGCSITGGHVYRGDLIPELDGHYFFADWCDGWVRSLLYADGEVQKVRDWSADLGAAKSVNAFGVGADGEMYLVNHEGSLFAILPAR
ncbi:MAG: PQQ-dependent sugar dehydrogenase [bacterium]|nr:PQQ-dependent sugar dehydrogenase [bacterium]